MQLPAMGEQSMQLPAKGEQFHDIEKLSSTAREMCRFLQKEIQLLTKRLSDQEN